MTVMTKDRHFANVVAVRCVISNSPFATIHHVHGRSIARRLTELGIPHSNGVALRGYSDALVIPLAHQFHVGANGVDTIGVESWEQLYGAQDRFVDLVSRHVGYDLWELHRAWTVTEGVPKILPRRL